MATIALPRFLEKLKTITESTPPDIASWSEDGTQYVVHDNRFESEILTQHFDAKRSLLSFIRQLNYYGFKKLENKGNSWAISHPKFLRDQPHLIYEIKRKTRKEHIVTASKDEVQSIRTEVGMMKASMMTEIENLKNQIYFLQNQLSQYIHATSQLQPNLMRYPEYDPPVMYNPEPPRSSKKRTPKEDGYQEYKKKRKKRGESSSNSMQMMNGGMDGGGGGFMSYMPKE